MGESEKSLVVTFNDNDEPQYKFNGAWHIKDLGHTRVGLWRAYKHHIAEVRRTNREGK